MLPATSVHGHGTGDLLDEGVVFRARRDGEVGVLGVVGAAADEGEGEQSRRQPGQPGEVAFREQRQPREPDDIEERGDGPEDASRPHAPLGQVAHNPCIGAKGSVHVVGPGREVQQHVAGEHNERADETDRKERDCRIHETLLSR